MLNYMYDQYGHISDLFRATVAILRGRGVGYNFERNPHKDYPSVAWIKVAISKGFPDEILNTFPTH